MTTSDDLRDQVATLWPYLDFVERYEWCHNIAWSEAGGRLDLDGNLTSAPEGDWQSRWVEVARDLAARAEPECADAWHGTPLRERAPVCSSCGARGHIP